jgi:hypothetical protein
MRENARLCGTVALRSVGVPSNWQGFCDKAYSEDSACSVLTTGTGIGKAC